MALRDHNLPCGIEVVGVGDVHFEVVEFDTLVLCELAQVQVEFLLRFYLTLLDVFIDLHVADFLFFGTLKLLHLFLR